MTLTREEFELASNEFLKLVSSFNESAKSPLDVRLQWLDRSPLLKVIIIRLHDEIEILYDNTFQAPVIYFPSQRRFEGEGFGKVSKISFGEHPINGLPMCYLHPCQTNSIMNELGFNDPLEYLIKFLGVYNDQVSKLNLPIELFSYFNSIKRETTVIYILNEREGALQSSPSHLCYDAMQLGVWYGIV